MKKLLLLFIIFTCQFTFAVELPPNNSWSWQHWNKTREQARLKAHLVKQINESGSSKTISAIVETKPTASKVGGVMLKRISHVAKTPGVQLIGTVAVMELIEAIGWVMEDGTYVKKFPEPDQPGPYLYGPSSSLYANSPQASCALQDTANAGSWTGKITYDASKGTYGSCVAENYASGWPIYRVINPNYDPNTIKEKTVPLTPSVLGAAMLGSGYADPNPDFDNSTVNNDQWTGVPDSYTPDDSGIGNELAEELENKADNAPQTTDGKESSLTDSKYSNDLTSNDNANDRSWQSGDGTEGSTDSTQTTDPETGTTSNTGTFKLPAFCDWAMTMCQWYDDWTSSDQVQKDHMTKTEEHQTEEKSFWEWFQKDDVKNNEEDSEVEDDNQLPELSTNTFNFGGMCPSDINLPIPDPFGHTNNLTLSFQTFCLWLTKLNPWIDVLGWIIAITILTGQRSANNEQ